MPNRSEYWIATSVRAALLGAALVLSQVNFQLFHILIELFSIGIMWAICILVWNTRDIIGNQAVLFLGLACFFIGLIDTFHTISYLNAGALTGPELNLAAQLWTAGRYLQAFAFLSAPLLLNRQIIPWRIIITLTCTTALLTGAVFSGMFPDCYLQDGSTTTFNDASELAIGAVLAVAMYQFHKRRQHFEPVIVRYILLSLAAALCAELFFTSYLSNEFTNVAGHVLKIMALWFLYKALIRGAIKNPFAMIFREIKSREQYLQTILQTTSDGFWVVDTGRVLRDVNGAYCRMSGYSREELVGISINALDASEDPVETEARTRRIIENGSELFETLHRRKNGSVFPVEVSITWIEEQGGSFVCFIRDLTERRLAEEKARKVEQLQSKMIAGIADVIVIVDSKGTNIYKSPNLERLFGWKPHEVVGTSGWDYIHPDDLAPMKAFFDNLLLEQGAVGNTECRYKCRDGSYRWIEFKASNLLHDPDIRGILCNYHDITERRHNELALFESEARFKALHNASFGGIAIHDRGKILECNQGLTEMTGYSATELIGMNGLLLIAEKTRDQVLDNIISGYEKPYEAIGLRKNGQEYPMRLEARNIPFRGKMVRAVEFRDLTEIKREEEEKKNLIIQLQQAQKMEAIGTLAGGIAHDFNNILGAIIGYAEMVLEESEPGSMTAKDLQKILQAGNRAKDLVNQILAFSRQTQAEKIPLQMALLVKEATKLLRSSLPTTITIEQEVARDSELIDADPTQIHQIIMNLCTNAFHAMEENGGTLSVKLSAVTLTADDLVSEPDVRPGRYMRLSVGDTGTGIEPEIRKRIFEPYFTTKETDKGTGMGLAIVHGIVKNCAGFISCESRVGMGTVFHIHIPCLRGYVSASTGDKKEVATAGTERVLFIDDEPMLAEMNKVMLEKSGYAVTVQTSSWEALATFSSRPEDFDIVITDQTMPGLTGFELAREMLRLRPELPIILCTGYSTIITEEKARSAGIKGFALKPLSKSRLTMLIREVLEKN
jgi:PAS domain S-box-containing protein